MGLFLLAVALPANADVVFALDPVGGAVSGSPGGFVGWGFSISSDTDWLYIDSFGFTSQTLPTTGFVDYSQIESTPVIGPGEANPFTQTFNQSATTGVGEYDIDPSAVVGAESDGTIVLTYDLFSVDPNDPSFNSDADTISTGNTLAADESITIVAPSASTPEPALGWLTGLFGLGACGLARTISRRRT
jgi:hypothetical protein